MAKLSEAITGAVFGRLTFIKLTWIKGDSRRYRAAECSCSCGNTVITRLHGLGVSSLSCGCLNLENTRAKVERIRRMECEIHQPTNPGQKCGQGRPIKTTTNIRLTRIGRRLRAGETLKYSFMTWVQNLKVIP